MGLGSWGQARRWRGLRSCLGSGGGAEEEWDAYDAMRIYPCFSVLFNVIVFLFEGVLCSKLRSRPRSIFGV